MQIFLRSLSDVGFQIGFGKDEDVHRITVRKPMKFVLMKIIQKSHIWLRFPINNIAEAQQECSAKYQFPCVFAAIHCIHTRISKPSEHGDE
nr:unnamed protein product [Callosobruchus analis]